MMRTTIWWMTLCILASFGPRANASATAVTIPAGAKFACPMETHPDETDPAAQGAYFSAEPGKCPRCGMALKPLNELEWVRVRESAEGGDIAYTCPNHQHVLSSGPGECPRCGKPLMPFKVMYTCPNPEHADVIRTHPGNCPHCGRGLAAYRGVWLDERMADRNLPPYPGPAEVAAYHCPVHPLVHSDKPGACTICARALVGAGENSPSDERPIPPTAKFVCPMKKCWQFSEQPGVCARCGMQLKPIDSVPWAKALRDRAASQYGHAYLCPMHPDTQRSDSPGVCAICGMQLVAESEFHRPHDAPSHIAAQVNYITEHYLELQRLLASDKSRDVARQALGIASASEALLKHIDDPSVHASEKLKPAVEQIHAAALQITGSELAEDRVTFVKLSAAMRTLVSEARPDRTRWPKLYIFHCPMSKGDWVQTTADKTNPYYGFQMLKCGELQEVK